MANARRDPVTGLTPAEARFVEQWLADGKTNGAAAYQKLYPKANSNTASREAKRILDRTKVQAYLAKIEERAQAIVVKKVAIDRAWVLDRLVEISDRCMQAVPMLDDDGKPTGMYTFQANGANRATELIGKEFGMFVDRKEVGRPGDFDKRTDEEILRSIRERQAKLGVVVRLPARS